MKKARLRICNETDITRLFSAHYVGGGRGFEDCPALEAYSNELSPCIKTIMGFTFIVEPTNDEQEIGEDAAGGGGIPNQHGVWIDLRSMITNPNTSGTITTTVDHNINYVTIMNQDQDIKTPDNFTQEPQVLGWSRDADGKITNRHPVQVANTLTAQKGNTMQNYVVEREVLNASADGTATTLTTAHHYSGNIIDPKRGQKEMGVLEILNPDKDGNARTIGTHYADMNAESVTRKSGDGYGYVRTAVKTPNFRIRKLTNRECFRLMGVDDADIDKIQAAGISKSQQYKLAGNSIVVDVLEAIFRKMFIDLSNEDAQLTLF